MNKKIILTSKNMVKKSVVENAVKLLFTNIKFEIIQIDTESVGAEPNGEEANINQITNAINMARKIDGTADYYVAMEGGVVENKDGMEEIAFVIIEDNKKRRAISRSVSFPIPPTVAEKVREGVEFADAVNMTYSTSDIKTNQGFVGLLTNGIVDKAALYFQPTVVAFAKFLKEEWFWK